MLRKRMATLAVPTAALLALGLPAAATADVVADWQMNEDWGASTLGDSSGNNYDGDVGDRVRTGVDLGGGARGYDFPGPAWGYDPGRMVTVPDGVGGRTDNLDPGTEPYAVTVRFRTHASEPNIVQKGQSGQTGGFWKLVLKNGYPRCHYRDENRRNRAIGFVRMGSRYQVDDGEWHVLRCERTATGVRVSLDGWASKFIRGTTGRIDNRRPFMIGGKLDCASASVGCDYFNGEIDYVTLEKG